MSEDESYPRQTNSLIPSDDPEVSSENPEQTNEDATRMEHQIKMMVTQVEDRHFHVCLKSFHDYQKMITYVLNRTQEMILRIPTDHYKYFLNSHMTKISRMKEALKKNCQVINYFAREGHTVRQCKTEYKPSEIEPTSYEMFGLVKNTLKQIYREWSEEGEIERDCSWRPVLEALYEFYPELMIEKTNGCYETTLKNRAEITVLVPGCGLGRLVFEVAAAGFSVGGVEFSYHMLITSKQFLQQHDKIPRLTIFPWFDDTLNKLNTDDQMFSCTFPDQKGLELRRNANNLNMTISPIDWDCVITSFFIDTANNIIDYVQKIHTILKKNGLWINIGPLHYQYSHLEDAVSLELTYEEFRNVIIGNNFDIIKENVFIQTPYLNNPKSMHTSHYNSVFFVAIKR